MDIVYIVGTGSRWKDNELRFSLRSIAKNGKNVGRVIIVGHLPSFIDESKVIHVPAKDESTIKHLNISKKIETAMDTLRISHGFLISSDDHFYTLPTDFDNYPIYHRGLIPDVPPNDNPYQRSLQQTKRWLMERGLGTYSTNPHCNTYIDPKVFKKVFADILEHNTPDGIEINCALGNTYAASGTPLVEFDDGKMMHVRSYDWWRNHAATHHVISVGDGAISSDFIRFIHDTFPEKCIYEKDDISREDLLACSIAYGKSDVALKRLRDQYQTCKVWADKGFAYVKHNGCIKTFKL